METKITISADQLRALLSVVNRAPLLPLEALALEALFNGWFAELKDQLEPLRALDRINELARQSIGADAAGDVLSGFASAVVANGGCQDTGSDASAH